MIVEQLYNKNQFVIDDSKNGFIYFQSYNSLICKLDLNNKKLYVYSDYNYSRTTQKHLYLFLNDYVYSVYKMIEYSKNKIKDFTKMLNSVVNDFEIIKDF